MLHIEKYFSLEHTIAKSIFDNIQYPWEAIPKIPEYLNHISSRLPSDYERIDEMIWIGKGTKIEKTALIKGPAIIGYDCDIRHAAFVREFVIAGNNVVIGNSTEVKNSILFNGVEIPHFNYVGDSILGYKAHLGAGAILSNFKATKDEINVIWSDNTRIKSGLTKFGAIIGDHAEIGCNSVLYPGSIIGKNAIVYPLSSVRKEIKENNILKNDGSIVQRN